MSDLVLTEVGRLRGVIAMYVEDLARAERERDEAVALLRALCEWIGESTLWQADPALRARLDAFLAGGAR